MASLARAVSLLLITFPATWAATAKPHLVFVLQDDLGYNDVAFTTGAPSTDASASANITALAREGIVLRQHYVHWHCSPSRRSFLTGRLPLHHGELLSGTNTDDIDLRWAWVSDKLKVSAIWRREEEMNESKNAPLERERRRISEAHLPEPRKKEKRRKEGRRRSDLSSRVQSRHVPTRRISRSHAKGVRLPELLVRQGPHGLPLDGAPAGRARLRALGPLPRRLGQLHDTRALRGRPPRAQRDRVLDRPLRPARARRGRGARRGRRAALPLPAVAGTSSISSSSHFLSCPFSLLLFRRAALPLYLPWRIK